jgi:hypothetical protein
VEQPRDRPASRRALSQRRSGRGAAACDFTDECLATVLPSGVPLKPSTIVVLIMNLAPDDGLTNGTKIIIVLQVE